MKNICIVYGKESGIYKTAIKHLTQIIFDYTLVYPDCKKADSLTESEDYRYIFIGTDSDNPFMNKKVVLSKKEEYCIKVANGNVYIQGFDESGVLYGCIDFYNKYILPKSLNHDSANYFNNPFECEFQDFEFRSSPSLPMRGLWTWGHVIYDYKGYIDNMVRLKMNTIIIWNDCVPMNIKEIIEYAHNSGISVILGYSWCWDVTFAEINFKKLDTYAEGIINNYEENYSSLDCDGIYFQSFTETHDDNINGVMIADTVTEFVNNTANVLLEKNPYLKLHFGLHASSVKDKLQYIKKIDSRIRIVWEDCGAFPYNYIPEKINDFDKTYEFTKDIINLRGEKELFGAVLKGFTCLDWSKFKHRTGPFYLGTASGKMLKNKTSEKAKTWKYVQAYWLKNADKAYEIIKLMKSESTNDICITALVEDGVFENHMYFPVALFGNMLWNCEADINDLICETALSDYVEFI